VLSAAAFLASEAQRLVGRAPMLTPGKVRELFHPEWVCGHAEFSARTGWQPRVSLAAGLRATLPALSSGDA
jgi:nucleoside-diphosphate-sugar epimerase